MTKLEDFQNVAQAIAYIFEKFYGIDIVREAIEGVKQSSCCTEKNPSPEPEILQESLPNRQDQQWLRQSTTDCEGEKTAKSSTSTGGGKTRKSSKVTHTTSLLGRTPCQDE